jgi:hypothetical protein
MAKVRTVHKNYESMQNYAIEKGNRVIDEMARINATVFMYKKSIDKSSMRKLKNEYMSLERRLLMLDVIVALPISFN